MGIVLGQSASVELVTNQLLLLATVVGAIAALPALIEFVVARKKRQERVQLSMEDERVDAMQVRLAGFDALLEDVADLVDRAKHPEFYRGLTLGNEMLIIGPALSGKKRLARRLAQLAGLQRVITVHNPRNTDALAHAKGLLRRATSERIMLLLPSLDQVFDSSPTQSERDEEVEAELDALIEMVANRPNVLVVGTATKLAEGDDLDNLFGMKIVLPGADAIARRTKPASEQLRAVLRDVALMYLRDAADAGCGLHGLTEDDAVALILARTGNAAEVQDAVEAARTSAVYAGRKRGSKVGLTREMLEKGVRRVMGS